MLMWTTTCIIAMAIGLSPLPGGGAAVATAAGASTYDLTGNWIGGGTVDGSSCDISTASDNTLDVTSMNTSTGAFSGSSEISGVGFVLSGSESGSGVTYTLSLGGYVSTVVGTVSEAGGGDLQIIGTWADNNGSGGSTCLVLPGKGTVGVTVASNKIPADGKSTTNVTAKVTDADGQPVDGDDVGFTTSDPGIQIGAVTALGGGSYSATLTASDKPGTVTITATDTTIGVSGTATLTQTPDDTVSVSLAPNPVNICSDTCTDASSVQASIHVKDAGGNGVSGQDIVLSADDSGVTFSPVTDQGDGSYSATVHPSDELGDVDITATDTSLDPPVSGTATLTQQCDPDADDGGTDSGNLEALRQPFAKSPGADCTKTQVRCQGAAFPDPFQCLITVTDTVKHPRKLSLLQTVGSITLSVKTTGGQFYTSNACQLQPQPGSNRAVSCSLAMLADPGPVSVTATFLDAPAYTQFHFSEATTSVTQGPAPSTSAKQSLKDYLSDAGNTNNVLGGRLLNWATGVGIVGVRNPTSAEGIGVAAGVGLLLWTGGAVEQWLGDALHDPPDPGYRKVPKPHVDPLPRKLLTKTTNATVRHLGRDEAELKALAHVVPTAVNRAVTAGKAGATRWRDRQIQAASRYLNQMSRYMYDAIRRQEQIARALARTKVGHQSFVAGTTKAGARKRVTVVQAIAGASVIRAERKVAALMAAVAKDPAPLSFPKLPAVFPALTASAPRGPSFSSERLTGVSGGRPRLVFTVAAAAGGDPIARLKLSLPRGLSFVSAALERGIALDGAKLAGHSVKSGYLVLSLKPATRKFTVTITAGALVATRSLRTEVKEHKVKSLAGSVLVTAGRTTSRLKLILAPTS